MAAFNQHCFKKSLQLIKNDFSRPLHNINFVGRDITHPEYITQSELKALLWTTKEMKAVGPNYNNILNSHHVSLLFPQPAPCQQISFERAAADLGLRFTTVYDTNYLNEPDICEVGRYLSKLSDVIVTNGLNHSHVQKLADGSNMPIINASCDNFNLFQALTQLFTLLENVGPLKRRCLAWIGPMHSLCNTFLYLGPKLGLDVKIFCPDDIKSMTSLNIQRAFGLCHGQSELHQCSSMEEAIYRADIIVTTMHDNPQYCITNKVIAEADLNWYFLHTLPRSKNEVTDEVFRHKNNLTWKSIENFRYVAMALLLRIFKNKTFSTSIPDFDGDY